MADTGLEILDPRNREHLDAFVELHEATLPDSVTCPSCTLTSTSVASTWLSRVSASQTSS